MSKPLQQLNRRKFRSRAGYVLVLVLVTLVLAATLLVQLANASLRSKVESLRAVKDLQLKWGNLSCERVALKQAEPYFESLETARRKTKQHIPAQIRQEVRLGAVRVQLLVADESAKANLNVLGAANLNQAYSALRNLVPPRYVPQMKPRPKYPAQYLGQIIDLRAVVLRHGHLRVIPEITSDITIWSESLNIHRASDEVVREVVSAVVPKGRADRLLETLRDSPNTDVANLLQRTIKNSNEQRRLKSMLSDRSGCFSVWTETLAEDSSRELSFRVRLTDEEGEIQSLRFVLE